METEMDQMKFTDRVQGLAHMKAQEGSRLYLAGRFGVRVGYKHGTIRRYSDWEYFDNVVTEQFRTNILDVRLRVGITSPVVYFAPIDGASPTGFIAGNTYATHTEWTENTDYDEATRQAWTPSAAAAQSITNPTAATITISAGGATIGGLALVNLDTKGDTAGGGGILLCGGDLAADKVLSEGETLDMTYTLNA